MKPQVPKLPCEKVTKKIHLAVLIYFSMNCASHPTIAIRTDLKPVRLVLTFHSALVGLIAIFAILMALVSVSPASAQTPDSPPWIALPFGDFFQLPVGSEGLVLNDRLLQAQGRQVQLNGYMVQQEKVAPGQFFLAQHPVLMSQHADGEADDLPPATVLVELALEQKDSFVAYTPGLIVIVGELDVGRKEDIDGRVSWVRLQLSSKSTQPMSGFEYLTYQHSMQHKH
jgi:hypothetical protein